MKTFIIAFAALIASISAAVPSNAVQQGESRIISDAISGIIEDLSQTIRDNGLDPLNIEQLDFSYALPVPVIFNAKAVVDNLKSTGLSNIVINRINYSILAFRLTFDISLPHIDASLDNASADVSFFASSLKGQLSGKLAIKDIRVVGDVRVSLGISGISISSMQLDLTLGGIHSDLKVTLVGHDLSEEVNRFLGVTVPTTMADFRADINELIEIIALDLINSLL